MKPVLTIAFGLLLVSLASAQEAGVAQAPRERVVVVDGPAIGERLDGVTRWDLGGGVAFSVVEHDRRNEFLNEDGEILHGIAEPLYVQEAMASPSGSCVVFRIQSYGTGEHLLRARAVKGKVVFERFMEQDDRDIIPRDWSIMEMGAVSDDGNTIVAEFAESVDGGVLYRWQTWRLQPVERLGIGLTVAKVRKPGMRGAREGPAGEITPAQLKRKTRPHASFLDATTPELIDYLDGVKPWDHGKGLASRIHIRGKTMDISDGEGTVLYSFTRETVIDPNLKVVASDSGTCLLFSLSYSGWTGSLVRVMPVDGKLRADELWKKPFDLFSGKRWFIPDLGAVSDDGTKALMEIGREGPDNRMIYGWQTWRLDPAELVTPRMTAANGLTFGSGQYGPAGGGAASHENLLHVKPPQPLRTEGAPKAVVPEQ